MRHPTTSSSSAAPKPRPGRSRCWRRSRTTSGPGAARPSSSSTTVRRSEPGAAASWTARVATDDVHHVRRGMVDDTGRVARIIADEGISLVLGGGGARAFAAIGVSRALGEAGCPIDAVCGVSAGAIVAGLVAMGLPYEEALGRCEGAARRIDYTLPVLRVDDRPELVRDARRHLRPDGHRGPPAPLLLHVGQSLRGAARRARLRLAAARRPCEHRDPRHPAARLARRRPPRRRRTAEQPADRPRAGAARRSAGCSP